MKFLSTTLLTVIFLLSISCNSNSQTVTNNNKHAVQSEDTKSIILNKNALTKLYELISKDSKNAELKDQEIIIGKSKISVSVESEHDVTANNKWIFAASFNTKLIDEKENLFTVGSIGIGEDQKDATETSIDEWLGLFGTAFSDLISNKNTGFTSGDFVIFPGLMGIRGDKPSQSWVDGSPEMNKKIIKALLPILNKTNSKITSVNLLLTTDSSGITSGECRINNEISQELYDELNKLDWKSSSGYMFKQYYLIKKK